MLGHRPDPLRNQGLFFEVLGRRQDLDLQLLLAQQPLELANLGVGLAQVAGGDKIFTGLDCRRRPASAKRFQLRITLGAMSSSRLSSATVFSPVRIRWTAVRLNSVLNTLRPSDFRGTAPMGPSRPAGAG